MSALVIVGEQNATQKQWKTALADEMEAAAEDAQFWLVLVPVNGDESNAVYSAMADWCGEQNPAIYFDVVTAEGAECSIEAGQVFQSDDPYNYAVERAASEGDDVKIVALLNEDDEELAEFLAAQYEAGVPSFNMLDGMLALEFEEEGEGDEEEGDEPEPEDDEPAAEAGQGYTTEALEAMTLKKVREIADAMGFDAGRAKKEDLIPAIIEEQGGEPEPVKPAKKAAATKAATKAAAPKNSVKPKVVTEDNAWKLALADAMEQVVVALRG